MVRDQFTSVSKLKANDAATVMKQLRRFTQNHRQMRLHRYKSLRFGPIQLPISLGAWTLHSGTFTTIQQTKLDSGGIGDPTHDAVHSVYFANQVPFSQPTNCGVAGHCSDILLAQRNQSCRNAHARGSHRSLNACMAAPNHNDIELFHVKPYFPIQNELKISSK